MSIEVGQKLDGKVTGITHFGAFIELPDNKTGLVHISEVSDGYIKEINTVLSVGQEVKVKVLSIAEDGKISLSIRQASDKPAAPKAPRRERSERPERSERDQETRPQRHPQRKTEEFSRQVAPSARKVEDFDQMMSSFLKDSEDRLSSLRRNTEGKRGGRGGRRS